MVSHWRHVISRRGSSAAKGLGIGVSISSMRPSITTRPTSAEVIDLAMDQETCFVSGPKFSA